MKNIYDTLQEMRTTLTELEAILDEGQRICQEALAMEPLKPITEEELEAIFAVPEDLLVDCDLETNICVL